MNQDVSRADLHVHCKYSNRPSEWLLRRIGSAECYTEPMEVYQRAKSAGMDFVTISDHNTIDGALEIAHLDDTFISCEVTTYFPDDDAKFHLLVTGITEAQFAEIDRLRVNIIELRDYLVQEDVLHSLAHPLFRVNSRVGVEHIEKVLLLFNRFEGINGTRDPRAAGLVKTIFRSLTREMIEDMQNKHGIATVGETPWKKTFTGGSDDHGGLYIASAYTETPKVDTVVEYLDKIRAGEHEMGGTSGSSLALSHSFYQIAHHYYNQVINKGASNKADFVSELLHQLIAPPAGTRTISDRVRSGMQGVFWRFRGVGPSSPERVLVDEFSRLIRGLKDSGLERGPDWAFHASCRVCHQWAWIAVGQFTKKLNEGRFIEGVQTLSSLGPIALSVIPYMAAFATQHKDERFLRAVADRFEVSRGMVERSERVAVIVESDPNKGALCDALEILVDTTRGQGLIPSLVSCRSDEPIVDMNVKNFLPVGYVTFFEGGDSNPFPPFLEIVAYLEQQKFREIVVTSPGPMGLIAILASKLLNIRCTVLAQPDFSKYVRRMTDDPNFEVLAEKYVSWFYAQADTVYCLSDPECDGLAAEGFSVTPLRKKTEAKQIDTPMAVA